MTPSSHRSRLLAVALAAAAIGVAIVAVPVLGQGAAAPRQDAAAPAADESPAIKKFEDKPGKGPKDKGPKVPETPVTLTGTVGTRTADDGDTAYTLTVNGKVYDLEAGPPWFWGDDHPLKGLVGKSVTIEGDQAEGSTSIDVRVADGKAVRAAGKPAWAGGWKVVGEKHPGWTKAKADKAAARHAEGHGRPSWAGPKLPESSPGN